MKDFVLGSMGKAGLGACIKCDEQYTLQKYSEKNCCV